MQGTVGCEDPRQWEIRRSLLILTLCLASIIAAAQPKTDQLKKMTWRSFPRLVNPTFDKKTETLSTDIYDMEGRKLARLIQRPHDTTTYEIMKDNVLSFSFVGGQYFENGQKAADELDVSNSTGNYFVLIYPVQKILMNSVNGVFMVRHEVNKIDADYYYGPGTKYITSYAYCNPEVPNQCYKIDFIDFRHHVSGFTVYRPMRFCDYDSLSCELISERMETLQSSIPKYIKFSIYWEGNSESIELFSKGLFIGTLVFPKNHYLFQSGYDWLELGNVK